MALTQGVSRPDVSGEFVEYPVAAGVTIFEGAAVSENNAGYAQPLTAGRKFLGFCDRTVGNSSGGAGEVYVRVKRRGTTILDIPGLSITANDRPNVYATDDDTFTLSASGNSLIGTVLRFDAPSRGFVDFEA